MDGKVNILIVDDKPEKLFALEAVLEDLHENIVRAYSGREALRALLNDEFAVILLDVNMPGMDGFETASLIRQRQNTADVPIIFVTAYGDELYSARGYSLGAVDYIQTPVVPDVLRTKVGVFVDLFNKSAQIQRQAQSLRRRASQLQKLAAASLAINSALSMEKMLQTVTDAARNIVETNQAITLYVFRSHATHKPTRTHAAASFSDVQAAWRNRAVPAKLLAGSVVAQTRSPVRLTAAELRDHPDWEIFNAPEMPPLGGGILAAPLSGRDGSSLGAICLGDRVGGDFTHDDEAVLVQLAQMASIAIENTLFAEERETNRIKDEFLSTLSHELRTPLGAILGWTSLLRMEDLGQDVSHGVEVIERNAKAQAKLIEDMLDVSRVTTGKLKLNRRPMNLSTVVLAAVESVRLDAESHEISIATAVGSGNDELIGDPDRLQQVIWNLVSNAVKFTPRNGHVDVQMQRLDSSLRVVVSDNGIGIQPRFLPHVFDRFRQADSTSTRHHSGLGIGLTIVRHIVELHGGAVRADSAGEGRGATFTLELPAMSRRSLSDTGDTISPPGSAGSSSSGVVDLEGIRVLVVDDEPDTREVIAEILRRSHAVVETAASAESALAQMLQARPDVLVSDIAMPERDGYDLIRNLQEIPSLQEPPIPAIALTAYARDEDRVRALSAGFRFHIAKPVDPAVLVSAVANAFPVAVADRDGEMAPTDGRLH
jgi:signal transduction histidine kinase